MLWYECHLFISPYTKTISTKLWFTSLYLHHKAKCDLLRHWHSVQIFPGSLYLVQKVEEQHTTLDVIYLYNSAWATLSWRKSSWLPLRGYKKCCQTSPASQRPQQHHKSSGCTQNRACKDDLPEWTIKMACLVKPTRLSFTKMSDLLMLTVLYVLSYKITSHKIRNKQLEDFSSIYKDVGKDMQTQRSEISTT